MNISTLSFRRAGLVAVLFSALFGYAAQAAVFNLHATIDGAQANAGAGTGSPGTGSAAVTYDDVSNLLSWNITWSGLTGTETFSHFHGPAAPGVNAGVQVGFPPSSPAIGSATISDLQAVDLLNDLWYINIHTDRDPGGEIRGQVTVVPEPAVTTFVGALAAIGTVVLLRRRRSV